MGILDELLPKEQKKKKTRTLGVPAPQRGFYTSQRKMRLDDFKAKGYPEVARIDGTLVLYDRGTDSMALTLEVDGEPIDVWVLYREAAEDMGWIPKEAPK